MGGQGSRGAPAPTPRPRPGWAQQQGQAGVVGSAPLQGQLAGRAGVSCVQEVRPSWVESPGGGLEVGHKQGYGELPCRTGISQPPLRWPCSLSPEVPETQAHGDLPAGLPAAGRLGLGSPQLGEDRGRPRLSLDPVDRAQQAVHGLQPALEDHRMPRRTPEDALCEF